MTAERDALMTTSNHGRHWDGQGRPPLPRGQRGAVMLIVTGIMAVVMVIALSLVAIGYKELQGAGEFVRHARSELLASAAVEHAIATLRADRKDYDSLLDPWRRRGDQPLELRGGAGNGAAAAVEQARPTPGGLSDYLTLEDEESRLNLNLAPARLLAALPGLNAAVAEAIVQARQTRRFATPDEVLQVAGVTPALYGGKGETDPGLRAFVTVWGSGKINVNTAPRPVLATLPGLSPRLIEGLISRRGQAPGPSSGPFQSSASVLAFLRLPAAAAEELGRLITVRSTAFRVLAVGQARAADRDGASVRIAAVVDRAAQPVRILYWRQLAAPLRQQPRGPVRGK